MADTPKRVGPIAVAAVAATVYTVPAATSIIIRNIHVANTGALPLSFNLSIGVDATGTRIYSGFSIPANGTLDTSTSIVLNAAEILQTFASAVGLTLTISGVEVT